MKISDKGIEFLIKEEGEVLTAYKCQAGVWTIGVGHTGDEVMPGLKITKEKSRELLKIDLKRFEDVVNKSVKYPIEQYQFDALVSLAFNIGVNAFANSTVVKKINAGADMKDVEEAWKMWRMGGGKVLPVLVARRGREINLYRGV
ncbi:lysozyme [Fusobacterium necrogenes]|uniref:lysozyme n=1 Tax=Fusobacterium necrogenes TaxID=858 RepID=UPI00255C9137|nr:lysozyme [Fusobacterium necrogenes]